MQIIGGGAAGAGICGVMVEVVVWIGGDIDSGQSEG